jgi:F-type H+-transporting ATPase subunit delta
MDQGLIPRRYAKALIKFADTPQRQQHLYLLMGNVVKAFDKDHLLQQTIKNPFVDNAAKEQLVFTAAGVSDPAKEKDLADFVKLLVANGRIDMMRDIALAYLNQYRQINNIYNVKIESAAPLNDADRQRIVDMIEKHLNGATAEYSYEVKPELIGGFVVNIDSERLDASISNELKQLRLKLIK